MGGARGPTGAGERCVMSAHPSAIPSLVPPICFARPIVHTRRRSCDVFFSVEIGSQSWPRTLAILHLAGSGLRHQVDADSGTAAAKRFLRPALRHLCLANIVFREVGAEMISIRSVWKRSHRPRRTSRHDEMRLALPRRGRGPASAIDRDMGRCAGWDFGEGELFLEFVDE